VKNKFDEDGRSRSEVKEYDGPEGKITHDLGKGKISRRLHPKDPPKRVLTHPGRVTEALYHRMYWISPFVLFQHGRTAHQLTDTKGAKPTDELASQEFLVKTRLSPIHCFSC